MQLADYLIAQQEWALKEYLSDYDVLDFPAISFSSWDMADHQVTLMNSTGRSTKTWQRLSDHEDVRILHDNESKFSQLWIAHKFGPYRAAALKFLRTSIGVQGPVDRLTAVDHVLPKSRNDFPGGVTAISFIDSGVNSSWGAGVEKSTKNRALKIRQGISLVSLAKALDVRGPKNGRLYQDVSKDLIARKVRSKLYENLIPNVSEVEKLSNEMMLITGKTTEHLLPEPAATRPAPRLNSFETERLSADFIPFLQEELRDGLGIMRQNLLDSFIHLDKDSDGSIDGYRLVVFLVSRAKHFGLAKIQSKRSEVLSPEGAVGYLLDHSGAYSSQDRFTRIGITPFDYST